MVLLIVTKAVWPGSMEDTYIHIPCNMSGMLSVVQHISYMYTVIIEMFMVDVLQA